MDPSVARVFAALKDLLAAYRLGEIDPVVALYDEASRPAIARTLRDAKARDAWLASVRKIQSFEPALVWQENGLYSCAMRMRTHDGAGNEVVVPFAVMLTGQFKFVAGEMTAPFHANLTRFLADPTRRPRELVANYELLTKPRSGGK